MKIKSTLIAIALLVGLNIHAQEAAVQDTTWKTGGVIGANFSQVSLSNWAAGGFSSVSGNALIGLFANMKKGKDSWDNNLDLGYGLLKQDDGKGEVLKTDDRIELNSKYGREAWSPAWNYSALVNFKTQFTEGLGERPTPDDARPVISDLLAPAYLLASLGLDYKPSDNFSWFISPLTAKFTIVKDQDLADFGAFGVDAAIRDVNGVITTPGANSRSEFGAFSRLAFNKELMENVNFLTSADAFLNYDDPTHVDVNWDALLSLKVNEYITTSLGASMKYDHDIAITDSNGDVGPRTQFKQVFAVGFNYLLK